MKKLIFTLFLMLTAFASAQNGKVAGLITDKDFDDDPVAFASVQLKGTTWAHSLTWMGSFP
jgi:hypothetical protein